MKQAIAHRLLNGGALAALALGAVLGAGTVKAQDITINMAVPDWPPTRFMKEEFDRSFKSPSGKNVSLVMDFIPWPSFYERVAASLTSGEQKYQMIVTDSQWLGSFVEGGYYKDLTEDMKNDPELTKIGRTAIYGSWFNFYLCHFKTTIKVPGLNNPIGTTIPINAPRCSLKQEVGE